MCTVRNVWTQTRQLSVVAGYQPGPGITRRTYCWLNSPQPESTWPQSPASGQLGISTAVSPIGILAGSTYARTTCWHRHRKLCHRCCQSVPVSGTLVRLQCGLCAGFMSCALNDCNGNDVADDCDFALPNGDCNENAVPDDCEAGFTYKLNDQTAQYVVLGEFGGRECRLHLAEPISRHTRRASVDAYFPSLHRLVAARNTSQSTAVFRPQPGWRSQRRTTGRISETTAVSHDSYYNGYPMVNVAIPPTYIGEPGTFFFIGGVLHCLYLSEPFESGWLQRWQRKSVHPINVLGELTHLQAKQIFTISPIMRRRSNSGPTGRSCCAAWLVIATATVYGTPATLPMECFRTTTTTASLIHAMCRPASSLILCLLAEMVK